MKPYVGSSRLPQQHEYCDEGCHLVELKSRIYEVFPSEDAFFSSLRDYIVNFNYEKVLLPDGTRALVAPGHSARIPWQGPRRWRPFQSRKGEREGYEVPAVACMSFILKRFRIGTIYDVGASSGYFSLVAASTVDREITAHAFEMQPHFNASINDVVAATPSLQQRLHAHVAGLTDHHAGHRDIWFSRTQMFEREPAPSQYREAWWRRLKFWLRGVKNRDKLVKASVLLTSIDHFAEEHRPPDFLKVDVDGYEALVVPGGRHTFATHRPFLLLELHSDKFLKRFGTHRGDIARQLFDLGYACAALTEHNDKSASQVIKVDLDSPLITRQATGMFLFY